VATCSSSVTNQLDPRCHRRGYFSVRFEIDGTDADADTVESLTDIILMALSLAPFEYSEQEVGVALCSVLALLLSEGDETVH